MTQWQRDQERQRNAELEIRRIRSQLQAVLEGGSLSGAAVVTGPPPVASIPPLGATSTWQNASGGARVAGDVLIENGDRTFTRTTTPADRLCIGILIDDTASGAEGRVRHGGYQAMVKVVGAVVAGDYLTTSATAGAAESVGATPTAGVFGLALTAAAGPGAGTIAAYLFCSAIGGVSGSTPTIEEVLLSGHDANTQSLIDLSFLDFERQFSSIISGTAFLISSVARIEGEGGVDDDLEALDVNSEPAAKYTWAFLLFTPGQGAVTIKDGVGNINTWGGGDLMLDATHPFALALRDGNTGDFWVWQPGASGTGPQGEQGNQGPPGNDGRDGTDGDQGPPGATGSAGATGATGATGSTGATGADGPPGYQGPPGVDGADGGPGGQGPPGPVGPYLNGIVSIAGIDSVVRITLAAATPFITLTGNFKADSHGAIGSGSLAGTAQILQVKETSGAASLNGIDVLLTLGSTAAGVQYTAIKGSMSMTAASTPTVSNMLGLSFTLSCLSGSTVTTDFTGCNVSVQGNTGATLNNLRGIYAETSFCPQVTHSTVAYLLNKTRNGTATLDNATVVLAGFTLGAAAGTVTLTNGYYFRVEAATTLGASVATNLYGLYVPNLLLGTNRYGVFIEDQTTGTLCRPLQIGATPLFIVKGTGEWTPAAGQTPVYLIENATLRQIQVKVYGVGGAGMAAADRILVAV